MYIQDNQERAPQTKTIITEPFNFILVFHHTWWETKKTQPDKQPSLFEGKKQKSLTTCGPPTHHNLILGEDRLCLFVCLFICPIESNDNDNKSLLKITEQEQY
mmetsp:Transcript_6106/g.8785  ORF Transcript_6106/g.8785 Transcript_6106/m.8785 type:complete len:103 (-) Transcript_6106:106-414(-)